MKVLELEIAERFRLEVRWRGGQPLGRCHYVDTGSGASIGLGGLWLGWVAIQPAPARIDAIA